MTDLLKKLEAAQAFDVTKAHREICDLAASGGRERWRMSIPPDTKYDSDMILQAPLDHIEKCAPLDKALRDCIRTLQEYRDDDFNAEADAPSSAALALSNLQRVIEGMGK